MKISLLNSFAGDKEKEFDTATDEGRAAASKLMSDLLRSGSAVFLEREVDGETKTYRVTGYDPETDKLTIRIDAPQDDSDPTSDRPKKHSHAGPRGHYQRRQTTIDSSSGNVVSVAPRSGG